MRHAYPDRFVAHRGFTLVESIIVLVVLSIAAVGIISLQSRIFSGQSSNKTIQVGVQLMQECAEKILATARTSGGYSDSSLTDRNADSSNCSEMTLTGYNAPTVTIVSGNSTTANMGACPNATGTDCKLVSITQGGLNSITLMLVKY